VIDEMSRRRAESRRFLHNLRRTGRSLGKAAKRAAGRGLAGVVLAGLLAVGSPALADSIPLHSPANFGWTGLWEYPTAEVVGDGKGWFGMSQVSPYQPYFVALGYLPDLEISFSLNTVMGGPVVTEGTGWYDEDYGDYKDKMLAMKWRIFRQNGYLPALAVGVTDLTGTELMKSWYGVATTRLGDLALTLGYGTDRMNGLFGGASWSPWPWLELKGEYSPMDYTKDIYSGIRKFKTNPANKWNLGMVVKTSLGLDASLSRQRDEWGFSVSYRFDLRKPFFAGTRKASKPLWIPPHTLAPSFAEADPEILAREIRDGVCGHYAERIRDVEIRVDQANRSVEAIYETDESSVADVTACVLTALAGLVPADAESIVLTPRVREIRVSRLTVPGELAEKIRNGTAEPEDLRKLYADWTDPEGKEAPTVASAFGNPLKNRSAFRAMLAWEPRIDRTLYNDFMQRFSLDLMWEGYWGKGFGSIFDVRIPLYNDIDIWWEPMTTSQTRIWQGALSKLQRTGKDSYLLGEAGWLDDTWFGGNLWFRKELSRGRFWVGARGSYVHERQTDSFGDLADDTITYNHPVIDEYNRFWGIDDSHAAEWLWGAWLQAGYRDPRYGLDASVSWGHFLGGYDTTFSAVGGWHYDYSYLEDLGWRVDVMRRWDDVGVGFYLAKTDIQAPDKDYSDAGIRLEIPMDMFFGDDRRHVWTQQFTLLSTWDVNSARMPGTWKDPDLLMRKVTPQVLQRDVVNRLAETLTPEEE
jgi:hypothetical protein